MVTAPTSLVVGVTFVDRLVSPRWARTLMLGVLVFVGIQAAGFVAAEIWKTVAFGRDVLGSGRG
jgi:hypothetical protein